MAIDLVDLGTCEIYGPFETPAAAHASASRSGFKSYALWENGKRIELIGNPPKPDDRSEQIE